MVVELYGVLERADRKQVTVAAWEGHPNAQGHRLIADGLWKVLAKTDGVELVPAAANNANGG